MSDTAQVRFNPVSWIRSLPAVRADLHALAPVVVVAVLFKLAISDGGRDPATLAWAQVATYALLAVLVWTGRLRLGSVGWAMLAMVVLTGLSALWSVRPEASVRQALLWTMYLGIYAITSSTLRTPAAARRMADALVAVAGWLVLVALFMFWGAGNPGMRWYSTFYWPNPFAGFLLLVLPLELARCLRAPTAREALAHGAMATLLGIAFVLTYSRGAWLALAAVLPVLAVLLRPPSWRTAAWRGVVTAGAIVGAVVFLTHSGPTSATPSIAARAASVADPGDYSIQGRLHFWRAAWEIFADHPLRGTGAGTFGSVHPAYQRDVRYYAKDAHNLYLQTMAELGLPGLLVLMVLVAAVARTWRRHLAVFRDSDAYPLSVGLGMGLLAFFLHSGVEMDWMFPAAPALASAIAGGAEAVLAPVRMPKSMGHRRAVSGAVAKVSAVVGLMCAAVTSAVLWETYRWAGEGRRLEREGRWEEATRTYLRAVAWNPLSAEYRVRAADGLVRLGSGNQERAERLLRAAMDVDRANAAHPLRLAHLLAAQPDSDGRRREMELLLMRCVNLDPVNRPEAYRMLARLYLAEDRRGEAASVYRHAERYLNGALASGVFYVFLWPQAAGFLQDASAFAAADGDRPRAIALLRQLIERDPHWVPAYLQLAAVLSADGRREEARDVIHAGMERAPQSEDLWVAWRVMGRNSSRYER